MLKIRYMDSSDCYTSILYFATSDFQQCLSILLRFVSSDKLLSNTVVKKQQMVGLWQLIYQYF